MLAELSQVPSLLDRFRHQSARDFTLYLCINNEECGTGYEENQKTLFLLRQVSDLPLVLIDRSSKGCGWSGKRKGVGWARKELFDLIVSQRPDTEIVVSLDADTDFAPDYLAAVRHLLLSHPDHSAFAVPYCHPLSGNDTTNRAMLRYECYMRHYLLQLLRIGSPYAFTALGSAMVFPVWAYRRVGGITPLSGGEDFYLLQKFAKTGRLLLSFADPMQNTSLAVRPQGRISWRVPFGTGPAIGHGLEAMEERYPFFSPAAFDAIRVTYDTLPRLYHADEETPMSPFLRQQLKTDNLWGPLRKNFKSQDLFVHACHERIDGLRILQFLKGRPDFRLPAAALPVDFQHDSIARLDHYRNQLLAQENLLRFQVQSMP